MTCKFDVLGVLCVLVAADVSGYKYTSQKTRDHDRYMPDYYYSYLYHKPYHEWELDDNAYRKGKSGKQMREHWLNVDCGYELVYYAHLNLPQTRCPNLYSPICADDGFTYLNDCDLRCFNSKRIGVIVFQTRQKNATLGRQMERFYFDKNEAGYHYEVLPTHFEPIPVVKRVRRGPCILGR